MTIILNGARTDVAAGATVGALTTALALPERGVAIAVDGEVVPRSAWASTLLTPDARVELVTAMQGG